MNLFTRVVFFSVGVLIALLTTSSPQTVRGDVFRQNQFDLYRLEMEARIKQIEQDLLEQDRRSKEAELTRDRQVVAFSVELNNLWYRLAHAQNDYFTVKWNQNAHDVNKAAEIRAIKDEISKREKQIREHLK